VIAKGLSEAKRKPKTLTTQKLHSQGL